MKEQLKIKSYKVGGELRYKIKRYYNFNFIGIDITIVLDPIKVTIFDEQDNPFSIKPRFGNAWAAQYFLEYYQKHHRSITYKGLKLIPIFPVVQSKDTHLDIILTYLNESGELQYCVTIPGEEDIVWGPLEELKQHINSIWS
jgi:hypothetical protein